MGLRKCFYCGAEESDGLKFEKHHVFGRINSDLWVLACLNCHSKHTLNQQKGIPKRTRLNNASKPDKFAFGMLSVGKHLCMIGRVMITLAKQQLKADSDE